MIEKHNFLELISLHVVGLVFLPFVIWRFEGVTLDFDFGAPAAACNVGPALKALVFGFLLDDFGFVLTSA